MNNKLLGIVLLLCVMANVSYLTYKVHKDKVENDKLARGQFPCTSYNMVLPKGVEAVQRKSGCWLVVFPPDECLECRAIGDYSETFWIPLETEPRALKTVHTPLDEDL